MAHARLANMNQSMFDLDYRTADHGFAIACPGGPISRVFEVADMVASLQVCPDRASAQVAATKPARA